MRKIMRAHNRIIQRSLRLDTGALGRQLQGVDEKVDMVMSTLNNQIKGLAGKVDGMVDSLEKTVITRGHGKVDEAQLINKITEHDDSLQKVGRQSGRHDESYWITTVRCSKDPRRSNKDTD